MEKEREFYIGEDGLEHCSVCNEPMEVLLPESFQRMFQMKSHPRFCACRRAEQEKEECERKVREHAHEVEKNTAVCFSERAIKEWNFNNDNGSNYCMPYAKQYVEHWDEVKKKNIGLLLWGMLVQEKVIWLLVLLMHYLSRRRKLL